jgi:hypothetical protein
MNYDKFQSQREQLQAEINAPHTKLNIDKSIFIKSKEEKLALNEVKKIHNRLPKEILKASKDEAISIILKSSPKFGGLSLIVK